MVRLLSWLVVTVVLGGLAFVAGSADLLPERVAAHFRAGGAADGWMSRESYLAFAALLVVVLPASLMAGFGWVPRRFERTLRLPHREHWLAAPRREATLGTLRAFGAFTALAAALFAIAMHAAVLDANAQQPPRLALVPFFAALGAFVAIVVGSTIALKRRFGRVRGA